ncbi:MAG: hypothetical protein LBT27_05310 [Prevotellaceae bacterium]|jgi:hypothetical protein|nr:hypothetical protein [Prevotellaceae bacterium]
MKKFLCIILLLNGLYAHSQFIVKDDVYDFPIKQGSKEWAEIESVEKRITALQIPDNVLLDISTEGLLETCLAFPYLIDILFCDNYQKGFEALVAEFNGFQELLKRKDLITVLLNKYKNLTTDVTSLRYQNSVEQGKFSFRHFVLEFMLTQDVVFKNLNLEQERQLFLLTAEHKKIKNSYLDIFSNLNFLSTNVLYAKKIINDPNFKFESIEQKKAISDFVNAPLYIDQQIIGDLEKQVMLNIK